MMIYMAFALYWEAQPFIEYLKLKRDADFEKVQLFKGSMTPKIPEIVLFLTGRGLLTGLWPQPMSAVSFLPALRIFL